MGKKNRERRYSENPSKTNHPVLVPIGSPTPLANLSLNSVLLHDWWLYMAKPRGLAVGGFECRGRQGQRVLWSAAIVKRHDATILESADGVTVAISGFINTSRTLENGFSLAVCSHFLFGFPYDWDEYASQPQRCSNKESVCSGRNGISSLLPSLGNLPIPVAKIRSVLMFSDEDSKQSVFDHVLQKLSTHDSQNAVDSNMRNKRTKVCTYAADDDGEKNKVKVIENGIDHDDNNLSKSGRKRTVKSQNEELSVLTPSIGVITRSMHRLKKHLTTEKQESNESLMKLKSNVTSRHDTNLSGRWQLQLQARYVKRDEGAAKNSWESREDLEKGEII